MLLVLLAVAALASACTGGGTRADQDRAAPLATVGAADVIDVSVSGAPGSYTFSVTVGSPDTGCQQFADWWEVVTEDGELLYRRILLHSHVDEQPFTRSAGPVAVDPGDTILVRAHMSTGGYGGAAMRGSVGAGFEPAEAPSGFAAEFASQAPLPQGCAF